MTTPTSSLRMTDIQTEFGGSNPILMSEYYGVNANVASSGAIRMSQFLGISNFAASTPDFSLFDTQISPQNASVNLTLYANGAYQGLQAGSIISSGTWLTGGGTGSNYECRLTKTAGSTTTPTTGTVNTWLALSSDQAWNLTETTNGFASRTLTGHLEIRVASGATLDNSSVYMEATVEV